MEDLSHSVITYQHIQTAAREDTNFSKLQSFITHGFPTIKKLLDPALRGYWKVRSQLTHSDDIICLDQRIVIPQANKNYTISRVALSTNMCQLFCNAFTHIPYYCRSPQWMGHHLHFKWREATTPSIEMIFRELFITFGVPDDLSTDGGPQFTANSFKMFSETWGVQHQKSSVEYPQSNGRAEVAVKSAKRII